MKTILSAIAIVCILFSVKGNDMKNQYNISLENYWEQPLTDIIYLDQIINDIVNNRRGYFMTGSATIIKASSTSDVAKVLDASFRNSRIIAYAGRNYIQANVSAKRNDNDRNDEIRIYAYKNDIGQIDTDKVKINWKGGPTGEISGNLSNVTMIHQPQSFLIIGTLQKNGYTIGVSLAISKEARTI